MFVVGQRTVLGSRRPRARFDGSTGSASVAMRDPRRAAGCTAGGVAVGSSLGLSAGFARAAGRSLWYVSLVVAGVVQIVVNRGRF